MREGCSPGVAAGGTSPPSRTCSTGWGSGSRIAPIPADVAHRGGHEVLVGHRPVRLGRRGALAVPGIDVSRYQGDIDWRQVRASGIDCAFIKATEGGDRIDDYFDEHWSKTKAAGVPRAAYHFYYFCRPAAEQAAWYIKNVPNDRSAMPPVLDMEWNPDSPTCRKRPDPATVRSEMKTFLSMVEKHYGKRPIIYTSVDFFDDNGLSSFRGYPYWLRSVAGHPDDKYARHPFTFWQYTGTGVVPGIRGNADINVFNGNMAAWKKWLKANTG